MPERLARLGADIGGTFTDVVLELGEQRFSTKVLTTYTAPEDAIIEGMYRVCKDAGIRPADISQIIHGTTLATNALIERRGAKTALITTEGFRDVIEMRTESRFEQYDLNLRLPEPLLPRNRRYVLKERMDASGNVLIPISKADIEALVDPLLAAGYESIAIGFLHAYANDEHEQLVASIFREKLPGVMLSLSSEVSPQMREYERFNTTVANAYIKPLMKSYLSRLRERLGDEGIACPIFLMHSGGGIISLESAAEFPVRLVESGPAGGAVFAANLATAYGLNKVLSFDMGGTTAKICLIRNQVPQTARVFEVARSYRFKKGSGMPISIPVIDMVEIGAGGGSLAHVDAMKQIRVGPESAGSEPGPACYGRGGEQPAVTDADLVLGKLDPDNFAAKTIPLHPGASRAALQSRLGDTLGMSAVEAAWGVAEMVDENMASAARMHAVENGEDLSEYTMIAFGGAAPLHAARLCEKLGIDRCLVPPGAGVGSAIGFLRAPFSFEANRSVYMNLADFSADTVRNLFKEMESEARRFVESCNSGADIMAEYKVYMRYAGQGWELPVALSKTQAESATKHELLALFEEQYERTFGRAVEGMDVEITVWSVNAFTKVESQAPLELVDSSQTRPAPAESQCDLFDTGSGVLTQACVINRGALSAGDSAAGPALVREDETTIVIPPGRELISQADGTIDIRRREQSKPLNAAITDKVSEVNFQVMWNRLISVVEEQAQALIRTAFSTSVREAGDLSAGVYNAQGNMLAQAVTGTPGHVNCMAEAVGHFIRRIGVEHMAEGDVYITNDPWEGTGHLHDITVVTPSFRNESLLGFFACTAHVVDIGGRGFGADANSVFEEGLYLPIMKFADRGTVDPTLIRLLRANVREPDQVVGDVYALATCNEFGHRRLMLMMDEFGLANLKSISEFVLEHSRTATLERINELEHGTASGGLRIDGYDKPIDLKVSVSIETDRIHCDFTGSSGLDKKGINVPLVYTKAYACYALKCAIAPDIPNNAASLAPFETTAPVNSIVNAVHPAPVALRHVIGHMVPDAVYGALDTLLPNTVPAEGAGSLCNFQVSLRPAGMSCEDDSQRAEVLTFNSGGSGARPTLDGMNATAFPSGVMTMPVEATEQVGPVIIWRKELRPDSGGAGQYRGGLGQFMDVGAQSGFEFDIQAMLDRVDHPALGRRGGRNGGATEIGQDDGTVMRGKGKQFVAAGRTVHMAFPGGGGYGDAGQRKESEVERDLARGYITADTAKREYGVTQERVDAVLHRAALGEEF